MSQDLENVSGDTQDASQGARYGLKGLSETPSGSPEPPSEPFLALFGWRGAAFTLILVSLLLLSWRLRHYGPAFCRLFVLLLVSVPAGACLGKGSCFAGKKNLRELA